MRCPDCHGWNPEDAAWCNQCARAFTSESTASAAQTGEDADAPGDAGPAQQAVADPPSVAPGAVSDPERPDTSAGDGEQPRIHAGAEGARWTCARCGVDNAFDTLVCPACGAPLATEAEGVDRLDAADWQRARRRAALGPGLGHLVAGQSGLGCAVSGLAAVWALGALALLAAGGARAAPAAGVLLLGVAALWGSAVLDLARRRERARPLVTGRGLLWLVVTVTVLSAVAAVLPVVGVASGGPG